MLTCRWRTDRIKRPMFSYTIHEPEEEINRYRKYLWALANSRELGPSNLAILRRIERDHARILNSLHGALQSRISETLKMVKDIADERKKTATSTLARNAFENASTDAKRMIADIGGVIPEKKRRVPA